MARYRKKIKWKSLLSAGLAVLMLVGAVVGITSITSKETKSISSLSFKVGAIDESGNYVDSDTSIYTKEMFECQGLTVEPDFEAAGTFRVFYYDQDKAFLGSTGVLNAADGVYIQGKSAVELSAKYARIMITPEPSVNEKSDDKEFKISFYEVVGYANEYTIMVNKEQPSGVYNFYQIDPDMVGKKYVVDASTGVKTVQDDAQFYASKWFEVVPGATYKLGVEDTFEGKQYAMFVYKLADGKYHTSQRIVLEGTNSGDMIWAEYTVRDDLDIVSGCVFVQDCTGEYPDLVINFTK